MFLQYFGLNVTPFGMSPRLDFLFKSSAFEESMAHLVYGLDSSEAIVLITGPIGSGKTMSLQSFLADLGDKYLSALVTNTQVTAIELLKLILEDLGVEAGPGWDKSDLLVAFKNLLVQARQDGRRVVVVIDEAQNLSTAVLEEVRLLTNLGQGMEQPVQVILVGQPELKQILDRAELAQLRQRIRVHYEVDSLDFEELVGYVNHRMEVAGCSYPVFDDGAMTRLFELTGGIPRLVNTYANEALLSAYVAQRKTVTAEDLVEAVEGGAVRPEGADQPLPSVKPAPIKSKAAPAKTRETGQEYARRSDRHSTARGRRVFWLVLLSLAVLGAGAWYWMFRDKEPQAASQVQPAVVAASIDTVPIAVAAGGQVETEAPQAAVIEKPAVAVTVSESSGYFVHVASFKDSLRSQVYLGRLESNAVAGRVEKETVDGGQWYRVYVGPVATRGEAKQVAKRLMTDGVISYYRVVGPTADDGNGTAVNGE